MHRGAVGQEGGRSSAVADNGREEEEGAEGVSPASVSAPNPQGEVLSAVRGKTVLLAKKALTVVDSKLESELPEELRGSPIALAAGRTAAVGLAVGAALLSLNALAVLLTVAHAVDHVPGVNRFFQGVGLSYVTWFYYEFAYKRDGGRRLRFLLTEWYTGAKDQFDVPQLSFSKRKADDV